MSEFIQDIFKAKLNHPKGGGHVEADRSVINHYNPGTMIQGFEATGYFVYDGVYVTERGKNTPRVWLGEKVQK